MTDAREELFRLCRGGFVGQLELLLDQNPNLIEERDATGATPLIAAAREGHDRNVAVLLERGADIEAVDNAGFTALMQACLNGRAAAARKLTVGGAYAGRVSSTGMTAASCAFGADFPALADDMRYVTAHEEPVAKAFWAREAARLATGTAKPLTVRKKPVSFSPR